MEQQNTRLRNAGFATFFFSGICAISAGVVVSLLQERYGFAYGMTGTLLSLMSVGNLLAGLLMGMLPRSVHGGTAMADGLLEALITAAARLPDRESSPAAHWKTGGCR